ncbi:MAG: hypothetical protein FDZ75_05045 [Actinobacteria bacterium]|nr:MAG: hypothetical protein FDZ75_05045 [Actinomycetota bacterium]
MTAAVSGRMRRRKAPRTSLTLILGAAALLAALSVASVASAGQSASGELFFYPCTDCHPVAENAPRSALPNKFEGHGIVLQGHDRLGRTKDEACLACHDDPSRNPGKLRIADGSFVDIKGDVALVCYRCHSTKYKEFVAGTHGRHKAKCTSAGCHDPHTPGFIFAEQLMPFTGSGFQFRVLPTRVAFTPLAGPAPQLPVQTPTAVVVTALLGFAVVAGLLGSIFVRRSNR